MDDFFWNRTAAANLILFGVLGEENSTRPGVYRFTSSTGLSVPDAHILSPDTDIAGNGESSKPNPGTPCVALMTSDGAQCFICGFQRPPVFDEDGDGDPSVGNPDDNNSSGDKVYRTAGGASFILKRGGAVVIEGGPGTGIIMNPVNNQMSLRSSNFRHIVDGYQALRGRKEPGGTQPETFHEESYLNQVGPSFDRERLTHGSVEGSARRQFSLASVTVVASQETVTLKTRETYFADGSWVGEGPKYQYGGSDASEPFVMGNALVECMSKLMDIIKALKVNTAWGPSTPPIPPTPIDLDKLKSELGDKILSNYMFLTKEPSSLQG